MTRRKTKPGALVTGVDSSFGVDPATVAAPLRHETPATPAAAPAPAQPQPDGEPGKRGRNRNAVEMMTLRLDVFALRKGGASYRAIARTLDIPVSYAHQLVEEELGKLSDVLGHSVEHHRQLELERVDTILARLDGMLREGRKVEKSADGKETIVVMKRPAVGYFFAYFRAMARRADLLGLDMPKRLELGTIGKERDLGDSELDDSIDRLMREIAAAEQRKTQPIEGK